MQSSGLTLGQKTEANSRKENNVKMVDGYTVVSKPPIKNLGVMIDAKLSFEEHLEYACQKADSGKELAKMLPNIGGPKYCQMLFLAFRVQSIFSVNKKNRFLEYPTVLLPLNFSYNLIY